MSFIRVSCTARVVPYTAKQGLFGNAFTSARVTVGFVSLADVVVSSFVWFFSFHIFYVSDRRRRTVVNGWVNNSLFSIPTTVQAHARSVQTVPVNIIIISRVRARVPELNGQSISESRICIEIKIN